MKNLILAALLTAALSLPMYSYAQYNSPGPSITGTVVAVDPTGGSITVHNTLNGQEKILNVSKKADLENVKKGDTVAVTLQNDDPTKATAVVKQ